MRLLLTAMVSCKALKPTLSFSSIFYYFSMAFFYCSKRWYSISWKALSSTRPRYESFRLTDDEAKEWFTTFEGSETEILEKLLASGLWSFIISFCDLIVFRYSYPPPDAELILTEGLI